MAASVVRAPATQPAAALADRIRAVSRLAQSRYATNERVPEQVTPPEKCSRSPSLYSSFAVAKGGSPAQTGRFCAPASIADRSLVRSAAAVSEMAIVTYQPSSALTRPGHLSSGRAGPVS